jgi:hypothetical protein
VSGASSPGGTMPSRTTTAQPPPDRRHSRVPTPAGAARSSRQSLSNCNHPSSSNRYGSWSSRRRTASVCRGSAPRTLRVRAADEAV